MSSKLFYIFIILSTLFSHPALAQSYEDKLNQADSLFTSQKYTEALTTYEDVFENSELFSLQMLLKMALIEEALGDYTSALYYLNVYYNYSPNKKVLKKMEDLAGQNKLQGYKYTDLEYFISLYHEYYYYIIFFFLLSALSYYIYLVIKKIRRKSLDYRLLLFMLILGASFYIANFEIIPSKGIIKNSNTYLMSAPSAASDPIDIADKGHRVVIIDKKDVWYKIKWEDQTAYILDGNLLLIENSESF